MKCSFSQKGFARDFKKLLLPGKRFPFPYGRYGTGMPQWPDGKVREKKQKTPVFSRFYVPFVEEKK
jgi:hypothetical protein